MRLAVPHDTDPKTVPPRAAAVGPNPALLGWAEFFQRLGDDARLPFAAPSTP